MPGGNPITVIGGGIAGLAVALALARRGNAVRVLERAEAISEIGAGLQISPNGTAVVKALGLGAELAEIGVSGAALELRNGASGAGVLRLDFSRAGSSHGYFYCHRADLIDIFDKAARAAGVEIRTGHRVAGIETGPQGNRLRLSDGTVLDAPLVLGADGLHSGLYSQLNPGAAPFFTGQVAWRAIIPEDPLAAAPVAQIFAGPGRHLVSYPLRGGTQRNIVAVEERAGWTAEGWHHRDDPDVLRKAFAGFGDPVPDWLSRIGETHIWGLFRHPVADRWHDRTCAILGDAAHPTLPFMAQGANMALEDAWVLASCMGTHPDPESAFSAYQSARMDRVRRIVDVSSRNARNYHLRNPLRAVAHAILRIGTRLSPDAPMRRFAWLYGHDVTETHP